MSVCVLHESLNDHSVVDVFVQIDRTGNPTCTRIVRAIPGNHPTKVRFCTLVIFSNELFIYFLVSAAF